METTPGLYDTECTVLWGATGGDVVLIGVLNGYKGSGISIQSSGDLTPVQVAELLTHIAKELRKGESSGSD